MSLFKTSFPARIQPTINSFIKGVVNILDDDGIWVLEFPYWIHDLETNQFDQIYHEHLLYYNIKTLNYCVCELLK